MKEASGHVDDTTCQVLHWNWHVHLPHHAIHCSSSIMWQSISVTGQKGAKERRSDCTQDICLNLDIRLDARPRPQTLDLASSQSCPPQMDIPYPEGTLHPRTAARPVAPVIETSRHQSFERVARAVAQLQLGEGQGAALASSTRTSWAELLSPQETRQPLSRRARECKPPAATLTACAGGSGE